MRFVKCFVFLLPFNFGLVALENFQIKAQEIQNQEIQQKIKDEDNSAATENTSLEKASENIADFKSDQLIEKYKFVISSLKKPEGNFYSTTIWPEFKKSLEKFYTNPNNINQKLWFDDGKLTLRAKSLLNFIQNIDTSGLNPEDYSFVTSSQFSTNQEEIEVTFTLGAMLIAQHLYGGRFPPSQLSRNFDYNFQKINPDDFLNDIKNFKSSNFTIFFAGYEPKHQGYKDLKKLLAMRLNNPKKRPLPPTRENPSNRVYETLPRISFEEKDIISTMELWRYIPKNLGSKYVFVNIPEFKLNIISNNQSTFETRVIVGTRKNQTPMFSDKIKHVVVNPKWNVPRSIIKNEFLPKLRTQPTYFSRKYQVVSALSGLPVDPNLIDWNNYNANNLPFHFTQPPGDNNALGKVKFLFPNHHAVYLHDTPQKSLFNRSKRAFSHGCVRVQNPIDFADALLKKENNLSKQRIEGMFGNKERWLNLRNQIPVHLVYIPTRAIDLDKDNPRIVRFNDVYGYGELLKRKLKL